MPVVIITPKFQIVRSIQLANLVPQMTYGATIQLVIVFAVDC